MVERGVGRYQKDKALDSESLILSVLRDGKWHRYQELLEKTRLSTATLSKHLKRLEGIIEKRIDLESGEYPYPVYYRIPERRAFGAALTLEPEVQNAIIAKGMIADLIHFFNFALSLSLLTDLEHYFTVKTQKRDEENETLFRQLFESFTINSYRENVYLLFESLKRKSKREVLKLLSEAKWQILVDYDKAGLGKETVKLWKEYMERESKEFLRNWEKYLESLQGEKVSEGRNK